MQVLFGIAAGFAVWTLGFSSGGGPAPLVPETQTQFSLDLEVVSAFDHHVVYAVEQRARPFYRILSLDPRTGAVETVYTVPEDAIIYGIALDPSKETLAIAYSTDFNLQGSGLWTLDLNSKEMTEVVPVTPDLYLTDISWSPNGDSILATHVDRRNSDEVLSIARVTVASGSAVILRESAIDPIQVQDSVFYLTVDENQARRSIGIIDSTGSTRTIDVGDSRYDLDHLLPGDTNQAVRVAILETAEGGVTFGEPAEAHGNHNVASSWWTVVTDPDGLPSPSGMEPIIVYDAAASNGAITYATAEGLAIGTTTRIDLIKSRAIRFVAS